VRLVFVAKCVLDHSRGELILVHSSYIINEVAVRSLVRAVWIFIRRCASKNVLQTACTALRCANKHFHDGYGT
jgi:hypothetical protein